MTTDKRIIAALGYLFTPLVPLVALCGNESDPFIRKHARQALYWTLPFLMLLALAVVVTIVTIQRDLLFVCVSPVLILLPFLPGAVWARRVHIGGDVTFPFGLGGSDRPRDS